MRERRDKHTEMQRQTEGQKQELETERQRQRSLFLKRSINLACTISPSSLPSSHGPGNSSVHPLHFSLLAAFSSSVLWTTFLLEAGTISSLPLRVSILPPAHPTCGGLYVLFF